MATNISELPFKSATSLPPRDIPRNTIEHTADPQVTATYIPPPPAQYIETPAKQGTMDKYLTEFRYPILVAILYIVYQNPVVQDHLVQLFPAIFVDNTIIQGVCFGIIYYIVLWGLDYVGAP